MFSRNVSPFSQGGMGKRVQKRGLNLWHEKDFLAPTPFVRQPLFETSDAGSRKQKGDLEISQLGVSVCNLLRSHAGMFRNPNPWCFLKSTASTNLSCTAVLLDKLYGLGAPNQCPSFKKSNESLLLLKASCLSRWKALFPR